MDFLKGFVAFLSAAFDFLTKMMAVPELHAIVLAVAVGMAISYALAQTLPAWTPIKVAVQYQRVIVFFAVVIVALANVFTPRMGAWAATVGVFTPLFYEWLGAIIFHRWPWLKPRAMLTDAEMHDRIVGKGK